METAVFKNGGMRANKKCIMSNNKLGLVVNVTSGAFDIKLNLHNTIVPAHQLSHKTPLADCQNRWAASAKTAANRLDIPTQICAGKEAGLACFPLL